MNRTIKKHLNKNLSQLNIDSIDGKYNIRFELGGEVYKNGTIERLNQVMHRAEEIYKQAIGFNEIIIVIKEYENEFYDENKTNKPYLSELIPIKQLSKYNGPFDQTYYDIDELGNKTEQIAKDELFCDLYIGNLTIDKKTVNKIIQGTANLEMGFEPSVPQDIYYYSITNKIGFRIYDDRGCDIWSNDKEQLRPIYNSLNEWILDYNRPEIDEYFK